MASQTVGLVTNVTSPQDRATNLDLEAMERAMLDSNAAAEAAKRECHLVPEGGDEMVEGKPSWCFDILARLDFAVAVLSTDGSLLMATDRARQSGLWEAAVVAGEGESLGVLNEAGRRLMTTISPSGETRVDVADPDGRRRWKGSAWFLEDGVIAIAARPESDGKSRVARLCAALGLEPQEARLALRVHAGDSNPDIARRYHLSVAAVRSRLWMLTRKLEVSNRAALAAKVARVLANGDGPGGHR
jgi:DNA-binding CsgD family transcriptional regulator